MRAELHAKYIRFVARKRQQLPKRESETIHGGAAANLPAILNIPNAHGGVVAGRREKRAVCAPADVIDTARVPHELAQALAARSVPQQERLVRRSRKHKPRAGRKPVEQAVGERMVLLGSGTCGSGCGGGELVQEHQMRILDGAHGQLVPAHGKHGFEPAAKLGFRRNIGLLGHIADACTCGCHS
jgi:hypothetical protein